jgi:hypothetical protein
MVCLDTRRSRGNWVPFMDSMLCTLTTYMCCLMNPSDPLDNVELFARSVPAFADLPSLVSKSVLFALSSHG